MKIILSVIFAAMFIMSCGDNQKTDPFTENQLQVFDYFPEDADYIMFMNLSALRQTEFWDNYFKSSLRNNDSNDWLSKFEKETGIGLQKGISEFYTATAWSGNNIIAFVFEEGSPKIKDYFRNPSNFDISKIDESEVYQLKGKGRSYFYFPNDSLLLFLTSRSYLTDIIKGTNKSINTKSELVSLIKSIKNKEHYWMATNEGSYAAALIEKLIPLNPDIPAKKIISSISEITLAARFDEGIDIESTWGCKSSKDAYLLSTAIKGALAMDLLSEQNYILGKMLKNLEVNRTNDKINMQLDLNEENIKELKELAKKENLEKKL